MACQDKCHDCGEPICENQCTCQIPDYSNIGECRGTAEITNCVNYSGNDDTCLAIVKPIGLTSVLQKIIAYVKNAFNRVSSSSLVVTTPGACDDLKIELVPSIQAGNILVLGSDGKPYVPNVVTPGTFTGAGSTCLTVADGDSVNSVLQKLINFTDDGVKNITSESLSIDRGTACDENVVAIELVPSEDDDNILVLGTDGLPYVPAAGIPEGVLTNVANGLHLASLHAGSATVAHLGGTLLENTAITGATYNFDLNYTESTFAFKPNSKRFYVENSGAGTDITINSQVPTGVFNYAVEKASLTPTPGFLTEGLVKVENSNATLGWKFPIAGNATPTIVPKSTAYIAASEASLNGYANEIRNLSPTTILTSGSLVSGKRYRVTVSTGGANFVPAGAANNTVGTTFVANGVTPTWGTGSLELLGNVRMSAPMADYTVSRSLHVATADTGEAAPNDTGMISILSPQYIEQQIFTNTQRANIGYLAEGSVSVNVDIAGGGRFARIGVAVPITIDSVVPAPQPTQYSSYTTWKNDYSPTTQGVMETLSPFVHFLGINTVNSSLTKVGINTNAPTAALDVTGTGPQLRIRTSFTPASATDTGNAGDIAWDANYIYVCIATNVWKRSAITTW